MFGLGAYADAGARRLELERRAPAKEKLGLSVFVFEPELERQKMLWNVWDSFERKTSSMNQ